MTTPDIDTLIADFRAGLDGVTPGPWRVHDDPRKWVTANVPDSAWRVNRDADAAHVARCSPENIQALLDEIERLRAEPPKPRDAIAVGDRVRKVSGYLWPGEVRAVFQTKSGALRYVVECTVKEVAGALHIYNAEQIARCADTELEPAPPALIEGSGA